MGKTWTVRGERNILKYAKSNASLVLHLAKNLRISDFFKVW